MDWRFWKNTGWLIVGSVFKFVFSLLINILWARYLGPADLGMINYVATYTAFFTALCGLGLNGVIVHELVNHKNNGEILGTAIGLRLIMGIISSVLMVIIVALIDRDNPIMISIAILQAIQLPFCAMDSMRYWYQRQLQSCASMISAVYKVYILVMGKPIRWFALGTTVDVALIGILYFLSYKKEDIGKLSFSKVSAQRMLKASTPFLVASLTGFIYSKIDILMIRHMLGSDKLVGLYTVAVTVCSYVSFIPTAVLDSARPIAIEAKSVSEVRYQNIMKKITAGILGIAVLYSITITIVGEAVLGILYGKAYIEALPSLRIAVWYTAFSYLGGIKSMWLLCEKKNKYVTPLVLMGAATNVVLNYLLIPRYGIEGAAWATLVTQILSNVVYPMLFSETRAFAYMAFDAVTLKDVLE